MKDYCHWCRQSAGFNCPPLTLRSAADNGKQMRCPQCARPITLIEVSQACAIIRKSKRTLYRWISDGWIQTLPLADDRRLIVYSSLFNPLAQPHPIESDGD